MIVTDKDYLNEKTTLFKLHQIAAWQLDLDNSPVELPALQRSFVWKVKQIESLWDSLLRGFPIGSFLLSKSEDEKLFLLDGQQRATSIAIGHYDPWINRKSEESEKNNFWSLKNIPVVWIDLAPKQKTPTQKFVVRVVTQSHPWGYQRINNEYRLSVPDRRNALRIFREIPQNKDKNYTQLSQLNIFPYDADLPVPLPFLIKAITCNEQDWQSTLIFMCKEYLPINNIKTAHSIGNSKKYLEQVTETINSQEFKNDIFSAIKNLRHVEIPGIVVKKEVLKDEDDSKNDDPTLFVRLNSSGTKIEGEELIYSIYKASFPEAKQLVENIGASYIAPSQVITLISRLALAEVENRYQRPLSVNEFRKKIQDLNFKNKLKELINKDDQNPAQIIFADALDVLLAKNDIAIPPVLIKSIIRNEPDLFLMLLQWIKINGHPKTIEIRRKILATITALCWFGTDNKKYVSEVWEKLNKKEFWNNPIFDKRFLTPLIRPSTLCNYLLRSVVENCEQWGNLYPDFSSEIIRNYMQLIDSEIENENDTKVLIYPMWDNFRNKLWRNRSLVLFAQRNYINQNFVDYNQMETLDDTNIPWDWDHIYPSSWVYGMWNINPNTRHWTNCIGNLRAIALEENRSENNSLSPKDRLLNVQEQSFIKKNDWEYWNLITGRINQDNSQMIKIHLSAIINRLCNIYDEWYSTLNIGELFNCENENI